MVVASQVVPTDSQSADEQYTVTLRGRRYPLRGREAQAPTPQQSERGRNERLADRLWEELPFALLADGCLDATQIVQAYTQSLTRLEERAGEVRQLFELLCHVNLQLRAESEMGGQERKEVLEKKRREILDRGAFAPKLDDGTLTAELVSESTEVVRERLERSLRQITASFVRETLAAFDRFVGRETVGLVEWTGGSSCKFHFFTETIVHLETGRKSRRGRKRRRAIDARTDETRQTVTHQRHGTRTHKHVRHEHHLMNAMACAPGAQSQAIPQGAQQLLDAIPDWLRPLVTVLEGDRIRECVIEREVHTEKWQKKRKEIKRQYETVHYHRDPAVVLDNYYVLTGWCEAAIQEEEARRAQAEGEADASRRRRQRDILARDTALRLWPVAAGALIVQLLAAMLTFFSVAVPPVLFGGALLAAGGAIPVWFAFRLLAISRTKEPEPEFLIASTAAVLAGAVSLHLLGLGVLQPSLSLCGLAVLAALGAYLVGRLAAESFRSLPELRYCARRAAPFPRFLRTRKDNMTEPFPAAPQQPTPDDSNPEATQSQTGGQDTSAPLESNLDTPPQAGRSWRSVLIAGVSVVGALMAFGLLLLAGYWNYQGQRASGAPTEQVSDSSEDWSKPKVPVSRGTDGVEGVERNAADTEEVDFNRKAERLEEQARRRARIVALRTAADRVRRSLEKLQTEVTTWQTQVETLLQSDKGRRIAASTPHTERFEAVFSAERPGESEIAALEDQLDALTDPLRLAEENPQSSYTPSESLNADLEELGRDARELLRRYEQDRLAVETLLEDVSTMEPAETTLAEAIDAHRRGVMRARTERIAEAERKARQDENQKIAEAQAEKVRLEKELERLRIEEEQKKLEAQKKEQLAEMEATEKARQEAIRKAELERRFEREYPSMKAALTPFISDGYNQPKSYGHERTATKGPVSFGKLQAAGLLTNTADGLAFLCKKFTIDTHDRDHGGFPAWNLDNTDWDRLQEVQDFLNEFGPLMVEKGLLAP